MFAASRNSRHIICWDIRNSGEICATYEREAMTNQRIAFDVRNGLLVSGGTSGNVRVWAGSEMSEFAAQNGMQFQLKVQTVR